MKEQTQLEKILLFIISEQPKNKFELDNARRKICAKLKVRQPSNRLILELYKQLLKQHKIKANKTLEIFLKKADIRSLSGVAVVTSLLKPYSCPGKCVYCPTEIRMPKSYLASEPAAARASALKFDPYEQMKRRIEMLQTSGHPTDKIEYIIKGGTWNAYPLNYQYWFILESFRACNELGRRKPIKTKLTEKSPLADLRAELQKQQKLNETAKHRIIGLTLETRPDAITPKTIFQMREQGCTRIELGLQAVDDKILKLIKRGHTLEQFKQAIFLLRQAGFKVDLHFMPDLPGSSPKKDIQMYEKLFEDIALKPDMVKIYPCTVIPSAELFGWYQKGKYTPQSPKQLFNSLLKMKLATPIYCRISRLIRDIPAGEISAGNQTTNLREELKKELQKIGKKCVCLRCREIGHSPKFGTELPHLFIEKYETLGGSEYFLSFEDKKRNAIFGFLRLRIPDLNRKITKSEQDLYETIPEIKNSAFIRELHTYGQLVGIGKNDKTASQHKGLGKKLMEKAEQIAKQNGYTKVSVISGIGVRGYYRKLGYKKQGTYMNKNLLELKNLG